MWKPIATELGIPWRTAEGMHWIIGEQEMARRANVHPFSNTIHPPSTGPLGNAEPLRFRPLSHYPSSPGNFQLEQTNDSQNSRTPRAASGASLDSDDHSHPTSTLYGSLHVGSMSLPVSSRLAVPAVFRSEARGDPQRTEVTSPKSHAPAFLGHINDIRQPETANRSSNILPSVAELEGGVSPFHSVDGRRASVSSCGSRQGSSSGKSSGGRYATKPHSI